MNIAIGGTSGLNMAAHPDRVKASKALDQIRDMLQGVDTSLLSPSTRSRILAILTSLANANGDLNIKDISKQIRDLSKSDPMYKGMIADQEADISPSQQDALDRASEMLSDGIDDISELSSLMGLIKGSSLINMGSFMIKFRDALSDFIVKQSQMILTDGSKESFAELAHFIEQVAGFVQDVASDVVDDESQKLSEALMAERFGIVPATTIADAVQAIDKTEQAGFQIKAAPNVQIPDPLPVAIPVAVAPVPPPITPEVTRAQSDHRIAATQELPQSGFSGSKERPSTVDTNAKKSAPQEPKDKDESHTAVTPRRSPHPPIYVPHDTHKEVPAAHLPTHNDWRKVTGHGDASFGENDSDGDKDASIVTIAGVKKRRNAEGAPSDELTDIHAEVKAMLTGLIQGNRDSFTVALCTELGRPIDRQLEKLQAKLDDVMGSISG